MRKHKTLKNKLVATAFLIAGFFLAVTTLDGTFLMVALVFGLPLFFAKKNWIC